MRSVIVAAATVVTAAAFLLGTPAAEAAFPGTNGKIAYYNLTPFPPEIHTVNPDGSSMGRLTTRGSNSEPDWSADGSKIAYIHFRRHGSASIGSMNADGSGKTVILSTFRPKFPTPVGPSWSPDATQLAFCAFGSNGQRVFTVNSDGSGLTNVSGIHNDCDPEWSPGGTQLVVDTEGRNAPHIVTMNVDGSGRAHIATGLTPDWSPDGSAVVFVTCCQGRTNIATVASNGSGLTTITDTPKRFEFTPAFSPDGTEIVFSRTQKRTVFSPDDLWSVQSNGTSPFRITHTKLRDEFDPDWQPT